MLSFYFLSQRKTTSRKINITQSDVPRAAGWSGPSASRASFLLGAARPWLRAFCATRLGPLPASPFLLEAHPEQLEMDRFSDISIFLNLLPIASLMTNALLEFIIRNTLVQFIIGGFWLLRFYAIGTRLLQTQVTLKWRVFYFSIERTGEGQL